MKTALAVALLSLVVLTGCTRDPEPPDEGDFYENTVELEDGTSVTCVVFQEYRKGGVSCDWSNRE